MTHIGQARWDFTEQNYGISRGDLPGSDGLDARKPDHFGPLLSFLGNELAEFGGRAGKRRPAEVGNPYFHLRIGQGRVGLHIRYYGLSKISVVSV